MSLIYDGKNIKRAKNLRKNATPQENHLWYDFLRLYPVCFQRQKAIGHYIADFYCHAAKLVVEIDGGQHFEQDAEQYDESRTADLAEFGLIVLRFSNREINLRFREVCEKIDLTVKARVAHNV
ncbi:MAG: endonuclease domain-containing protein [Oscillospiraceae bacterium]|nr:endonuclease domain-containing protein [Oscillospiraceae bacterium]